jgi:hypothetical protein
MNFLGGYPFALGLTLLVEVLLIALMSPKESRRAYLRAALLLNLFTHPLANLAFWSWPALFIEIELGVLLLETLGYSLVLGLRVPRALFLAVVANGATVAASLLLR